MTELFPESRLGEGRTSRSPCAGLGRAAIPRSCAVDAFRGSTGPCIPNPRATPPSTDSRRCLGVSSPPARRPAVPASTLFTNGVPPVSCPRAEGRAVFLPDASLATCITGKIFLRRFKKDLPENQPKSDVSKSLISPQARLLISCMLHFHLKYLRTWDNAYFHGEYNLEVKGKR